MIFRMRIGSNLSIWFDKVVLLWYSHPRHFQVEPIVIHFLNNWVFILVSVVGEFGLLAFPLGTFNRSILAE